MATHSSILAWRIPWTEERDELQSMGSVRHDLVTEHACMGMHVFRISRYSQFGKMVVLIYTSMSICFFLIIFVEFCFSFSSCPQAHRMNEPLSLVHDAI